MHFSCICTWYKSFDIPMPAYWYYCWFIYIYIIISKSISLSTNLPLYLYICQIHAYISLVLLCLIIYLYIYIYIIYLFIYVYVCLSAYLQCPFSWLLAEDMPSLLTHTGQRRDILPGAARLQFDAPLLQVWIPGPADKSIWAWCLTGSEKLLGVDI